MRMRFDEIFATNPDGTVTPIVTVQLGPATMSAGSARIPPGAASFGGVRISDFYGLDLDIEVTNGVHVIKGYFR